jgi:hypothetical protein
MENNLVISTVKREAHITVIEANVALVARLMEIQCTYMYNVELARDMSLRLVKDLADGCDVLTNEFHNELYRYGVLRNDDGTLAVMPEPTCHD